MKIRVYYEDTDSLGVVNHASYFKFCERARLELFFQKGVKPHSYTDMECFVVKNINCDFINSAELGDELEVKTEVLSRKNSSLILVQDIFKGDELIFTAEIILVHLKNYKANKIPDTLYRVFDSNI